MRGASIDRTRRPALTALALILLLLSIGCSPEPDDGTPGHEDGVPVRGGTLVLGSISDIDSWNFYLSRQNFAVGLLNRIYLPLGRQIGDQKDGPPSFEPSLAESWSFSDDGLTLTVTLRDAYWSDGRPITAADVVFTWKAQVSPDVAWIGFSSKEHITEVAALDARTVAIRFDRVYPDRLSDAVAGAILPAHIFGEVPFDQWRTHDWSEVTVGSGPFVLERHSPATEIVLVRNPRRGENEPPWVDRVVARIVPDAGNLLTQYLSGALDYLEGVPPHDAERLRSAEGRLVPLDSPSYDFIGWNGMRPPFDDPEVRLAMTFAIDRRAIVEELLYGFGRVSAGPVPSFWWAADRGLEPWPYDPGRAVQILGSLGYRPRDGDGVLVRDGQPLEIELVTNAGNRVRSEVMVKVQDQLRRVGVVVRVGPLEMSTLREKVESGDFDAFLGAWVVSGKVELAGIFGVNGPQNVVGYRSEQLEDLFDRLARVSDWEATKPLLDAIQQRIHEDQPYTFLYEAKRLAAVGPRLRDVDIEVPSDSLAFLEDAWILEP